MRRQKVRRIWRWRYLLLLALPVAAAALACGGTLQIGIEFEDAPAGADVAEATPAGTVAALMAENVRLETQIAARAATSTPTPAPVEASPADAGATEAPPAAGSYVVLTIRGVVASVIAESNLVSLAAPVSGIEGVQAFEWTDIRTGDGQPAQIADLVPCTTIRAAGAQGGRDPPRRRDCHHRRCGGAARHVQRRESPTPTNSICAPPPALPPRS
ncbi:MAG: hypothetical protein M5R40_13650 [Anaerolineae bacterium]|nr:hypothetical protein [Anaerolineae bacterium]